MHLYDGDYADYVSKFRKVYGDDNERVLVTTANMVWNFAFVMKENDWVICPSSATGYLLVGKIIGNYIPDFHDESGMYKNTSEVYLHLRRVRWLYVVSKKDARYSKLNKIGRLTVTQPDISIDNLKSILNGNLPNDTVLTKKDEVIKKSLKSDELNPPVAIDLDEEDDLDALPEYSLTESGELDDDSNPYEN